MTHLDEGVLVALRDGESVDAAALEHVDACGACSAALEEVERRRGRVEESLSSQSAHADLAEAKSRVRARLDADRALRDGSPRGLRDLRRAAAILAVTAGAAYALPGSPIPAWLDLEPTAPPSHDVVSVPEVTEDPGQEVILVPTADGIEIVLTDVPSGTEVEMLWLAGATARISGGPGVRYSVADGRVSATAPNGPVRLGVPRTAPMISITINGRTVFSGTSAGGQVSNVTTRSTDRIVFRAPGP